MQLKQEIRDTLVNQPIGAVLRIEPWWRCLRFTLSFGSGLLWANINGLNLIYHLSSHAGSGHSHVLERPAHLRRDAKFSFPARL